MRNPDFGSWVRATAFNLTLTGRMIDNLLLMDFYERQHIQKGLGYEYSGYCHHQNEAMRLRDRGLVEKCKKEGYTGCWVLTEAGKHVCQLLLIAGFKTELHDLLDKKE